MVLLAILAVGVLIIFHEWGHFFFARLAGMSVRRFSVGFGPALARFERNGTEYQIGLIPLGGYVQIDGMSPDDGTDPNAPGSYQRAAFHQKLSTIFAGPLANYVLGFALLFTFFAAFNEDPRPPVRVVDVAPESPAAAAGLKSGDLVLGVGEGRFEKIAEFAEAIAKSDGQAVAFAVRREGGEVESVAVTPRRDGQRLLIGIAFEPAEFVPRHLGVVDALGAAWNETWSMSGQMLQGLAALVTPGSSVGVTGPLGIVQGLSAQLERSTTQALRGVAQLSIMLGLFNLLPIPALDGSRLLFLLLGAVRRKPLNARVEAVVHGVGMLLLLGLLVLVSIKDVVRIVAG